MNISELIPGNFYTNQKIKSVFLCSTQGGMRRSHRTNSLVLVADHNKSLYEDKWINDLFHYTGMGSVNDQSLEFMQNKTLYNSNETNIKVYLFEVHTHNNYLYVGQVKLHGKPYQSKQKDKNNKSRSVWVFPLKPIDGAPVIDFEEISKNLKKHARNAKKLSIQELKRRAEENKQINQKGGSRLVESTYHYRCPYLSEYIKRIANGVCQLCNEDAPFLNKNGDYYLETHHIVWMSRGGKDIATNLVALCPNCHKKMHILDKRSDIERLYRIAKLH